ncbi:hypothetical protein CANCADRAFT_13977, partial [Tortispora caseinolytica NRRL Y-17796]
LISGTLFATGGSIAQIINMRTDPDTHQQFDWYKTLRLGLYGGLVFAPLAKRWMSFVQSKVQITTAGNTIKDTLARTFVDQSIFPCGIIFCYFTINGLTDGKSIDEIKLHLKHHYVSTLLTNWTVWPVVQFVNYTFIPLARRLLFVNVFSLFWNVFLAVR